MDNEKKVNKLISILLDKHKPENGRVKAAIALGNIGDPTAVEPLIRALEDDCELVRRGAVWALGNIDYSKTLELRKKAVEALKAVLIGDKETQTPKDDNKEVRVWAVWALGNIGDIRAVEPLIRALEDEDEDVRKGAAEALGKITSKLEGIEIELAEIITIKSMWILESAAKGEEKNVREIANKLLSKLGDLPGTLSELNILRRTTGQQQQVSNTKPLLERTRTQKGTIPG